MDIEIGAVTERSEDKDDASEGSGGRDLVATTAALIPQGGGRGGGPLGRPPSRVPGGCAGGGTNVGGSRGRHRASPKRGHKRR